MLIAGGQVRLRERTRFRLAPNVLALGFTSLLTDVSSEMVATVLPFYLVVHLGLSPLHFGVIDGLQQGVGALWRLVGGAAADRWRRYKEVAAVGYGVSAACKLLLPAAGSAWPWIAAIVALDRSGKGVRTAPRDALISLSAEPAHVATSFGVHRALDSAGAALGPLVALAILAVWSDAFDLVFVASFAFAVLGLGVLQVFAANPRDPVAAGELRFAASLRLAARSPALRALALAALALSLAGASSGFLFLALQSRAGFNAGYFPLLYVGASASFLLLAVPAGLLADRFGRRATWLVGHALLLPVYGVALRFGGDTAGIALCVALLGAHQALTDGVLAAIATPLLPETVRGSGLAALAALVQLGGALAALGFGALWARAGLEAALLYFAVGLSVAWAIACAVLAFAGRSSPPRAGGSQ